MSDNIHYISVSAYVLTLYHVFLPGLNKRISSSLLSKFSFPVNNGKGIHLKYVNPKLINELFKDRNG